MTSVASDSLTGTPRIAAMRVPIKAWTGVRMKMSAKGIGWMAMPLSVDEIRADLDSFYRRIEALHKQGIDLR